MSHDVIAISKLFFTRAYKAARFFIHSDREKERKCSLVERVECSKKALFCGDFCDKNQVIILVILVLVSLIFI